MCGRFALKLPPAALKDYFDLDEAPDYGPRYNIAPSTPILAIRQAEGVRRADPLRWGLIPHWAKDEKIGYSTINARAETVAAKPAFREAFRRRRCLIPADGFYEWQAQPGTKAKQPYFISRTDDAPLAFAGLWERWRPPQGNPLESCSIIVTAANGLMPTHPRPHAGPARPGRLRGLAGPGQPRHERRDQDAPVLPGRADAGCAGEFAGEQSEER